MTFDLTKKLKFTLVPVKDPAKLVPQVRTTPHTQPREQFTCSVPWGSEEYKMLNSGFDVCDPVRIDWVDYLIMKKETELFPGSLVTFTLEKM